MSILSLIISWGYHEANTNINTNPIDNSRYVDRFTIIEYIVSFLVDIDKSQGNSVIKG